MKLSQYQKKSLGIKKVEDQEKFIWNEQLARVYENIDERNSELGDQGQTFAQFKKMEKRPPNQQGTGRHKFSYVEQIQLIFIPKKGLSEPTPAIKEIICKFLQTYLKIPCQPKKSIKMQVDTKQLIDKQKKTLFQIEHFEEMADAHDILSVLLQYHRQKTVLVAFLEKLIHQQGRPIDGLADGNGVAIIYYSRKDLNTDLETYLLTLVHETFHTLGFDHCMAWKCLMNGYTNFESWLCPACSKKLYYELKIDSPKATVQWMHEVVQFYGQIKARKSIRKGNRLIKAIQDSES